MQYIIKLFAEITIKSSPVRKAFIRQLRRNIRSICTDIDAALKITGTWDQIEIAYDPPAAADEVCLSDRLKHIPGIAEIQLVDVYTFSSLESLSEKLLAVWSPVIDGKSFCVRVKRTGNHNFTSMEAERFLGSVLVNRIPGAKVNLKSPEHVIRLTVKQQEYYIIRKTVKGLGGYPLGTQEGVLSLISGGFDSGVSSFMTMKRGMPTHFCFFNLGGREHELAVQEIAYYLWEKFGSSHHVHFASIPFEKVVHHIVTYVDNAYMGVVLKRMMLRVACRLADDLNLQALTTGEAVAQVSSQTLPNLAAIDAVSERLILRPLIAMDKQNIIDYAREIGTEQFSSQMPEYCAVISKNPVTRAQKQKLDAAESQFKFSLLADAFDNRVVSDISELGNTGQQNFTKIDFVSTPAPDDVVVDVRHDNEQEDSPMEPEKFRVLSIPFYRLSRAIKSLPADHRYLLYCPKGVMSRLHASHLIDEGYKNIAVYRPEQPVN